MDFFKKNKTITGVVVIAIFVLLYFVFYSSATPTLTSSDVLSTDPVSQALLVTLANLHTIRLDGSIFSDPAFVSLSDFGVVIPTQPAGRRNPFIPAGTVLQTSSPTKPATTGAVH